MCVNTTCRRHFDPMIGGTAYMLASLFCRVYCIRSHCGAAMSVIRDRMGEEARNRVEAVSVIASAMTQ